MRLAFCTLATLLLASPVIAEDKQPIEKPKPNTLTAKEIADGWLILFDGETTFGWKIDGAAEVKDGVLILGKDKKTVAYPSAHFGPDYELEVEWQGQGTAVVGKSVVEFTSFDPSSGKWATMTYRWNGKGLILGNLGGAAIKTSPNETGDIRQSPLRITTDGTNPAVLRSIKLRPLQTKPLFTGKNLDGWKVNAADPKRMLSKWEVTKDQELSLKNGPGDLVTEKEFDNFVLQFECKTLGDGLNSGVFFRCIPGQYQNGYEAQINNAILDKDRTKPKDAGTGAIYRRIASRKVVSNDNEWFTMTVVADGKHIATWVNGYQTVDWIDDRKDDENPRKGFRAAKGPISLQGHDPTTDILFKNIRIAELPAAK